MSNNGRHSGHRHSGHDVVFVAFAMMLLLLLLLLLLLVAENLLEEERIGFLQLIIMSFFLHKSKFHHPWSCVRDECV
jgi:hypothetical protein